MRIYNTIYIMNEKYSAIKKYLKTEKGRSATKRYQQSEKGKLAQRIANKNWRSKKEGKESVLASQRLWKFGINKSDLDRMVYDHAGACSICRDNFPIGGKFHIDHDHITGRIRGLLCHGCNVGLGIFKDSPDRLRTAADYLSRIQ